MKERLQKILTHYSLTATQFASEISVQRSGISHILSGRNQPSYDFIVKILTRYGEINPEWLLLGKGNMLKVPPVNLKMPEPDLFSSLNSSKPGKITAPKALKAEKEVEEKSTKVTNVTIPENIVMFFSDGTFRSYKATLKE